MAEITRMVLVLAFAAGIGGCGLVSRDHRKGGTVPEPITPVQKATASPANPDSAILAEFNARLDHYIRFQREVEKDSPKQKETADRAKTVAAQEILAAKIRTLRKDAKQGDIFTPQVAALFKRLMNPELKGPERKETRQALSEEDGEVAHVWLKVNATYPQTEVLATTPANLLQKLPQLPMDVEYRITAKRHLLLRDVDANIIVDYILNAIR
jgi:hypothetical protein